jgi:alkylated DNA repair dioxygenase AlkB
MDHDLPLTSTLTKGVAEMLHFDFVTKEEEARLISDIKTAMAGLPVNPVGRSRILRYGWDYDAEQNWLGAFPVWLLFLSSTLAPFNSVSVNQYKPGDSIAHHTDSKDFGEPIQILSLGATAVMAFRRNKCCALPFSLPLPARSLLTLAGEHRWNWTHSVRPVRSLRYSIVFRQRILK